MVSKKIKELRDELRSESSAPRIKELKSLISQEAARERAEVAALPRPGPGESFRHKDFDPRVVESVTREQELQIAKSPEQVAREAAAAIPKEQVARQLEAAGAFEEVTPVEVELAPERATPLEKLPVVGPVIGAISSIITPQEKEAELKAFGFDVATSPETVRELALKDIRDKSFKEGVTLSESFGTLIESIPVVGSLASKFAKGLIETPSANAENVIDEINKIKEAASTGQEKVRNGLEDPDYGLGRAREMEEDLSKLEGRLKALINTSPILRANTDEVNKIQEQILEAREKVSRYRTASEFGLTASLTGTGRIIPTDEQLFLELKGK